MKELSVTLYDIFGYLVPGGLFLVASLLVYWTFFVNGLADLDQLTVPICVAGGFGSYLLGHMVQAVANQIMQLFKKNTDIVLTSKAASNAWVKIVELATAKANKELGLPYGYIIGMSELFEYCVRCHGNLDQKEISL